MLNIFTNHLSLNKFLPMCSLNYISILSNFREFSTFLVAAQPVTVRKDEGSTTMLFLSRCQMRQETCFEQFESKYDMGCTQEGVLCMRRDISSLSPNLILILIHIEAFHWQVDIMVIHPDDFLILTPPKFVICILDAIR